MKKRNSLLALIISGILIGCASTTNKGTVGVERSQFLLVGAEQLEQGAKQAYAEVLSKAEAEDALNTNPQLTNRVRSIGQRLINQVGVFRSDAKNWDWEISVITSEELNAWCMPGGKIGVYSGIVEKLELTDDEIAAIMGHEIAHALREHSREQASRAMAAQLGVLGGVMIAGGATQATMDMATLATQVTFILPNSRTAESEADLMGVELAARAGFDPRASMSLWQKMLKSGGQRPPEFMSTHPDPKNRIQTLEVVSGRVMPLYEDARTAQ